MKAQRIFLWLMAFAVICVLPFIGCGDDDDDDDSGDESADDDDDNDDNDDDNDNDDDDDDVGPGHITYHIDGGHLYRIEAVDGATPQDVTLALDAIAAGGGEDWLNSSPNGDWLVFETERFGCDGWACLAIASGDLTQAEAVMSGGDVVHVEGFSAISSGGDTLVYPASFAAGTGLFAMTKTKAGWSSPTLLSGDSPYDFNAMPAISANGETVLFDCGDVPYGQDGTAICEVGVDGAGFQVLITPTDYPGGTAVNALHHADYAGSGAIFFEADWGGTERIWHMPAGGGTPSMVDESLNNDNSPCVLPDGQIASLWLERPDGDGLHELKIMKTDGSYFMALVDLDIQDAGIGCGL